MKVGEVWRNYLGTSVEITELVTTPQGVNLVGLVNPMGHVIYTTEAEFLKNHCRNTTPKGLVVIFEELDSEFKKIIKPYTVVTCRHMENMSLLIFKVKGEENHVKFEVKKVPFSDNYELSHYGSLLYRFDDQSFDKEKFVQVVKSKLTDYVNTEKAELERNLNVLKKLGFK
jgi:hypothetical protein